MPLDDQFCTPCAIGVKIILGTGAPLLPIAGESQEMSSITGILTMLDVLGRYLRFPSTKKLLIMTAREPTRGIAACLGFTAPSPTS